MFRPIDRGVAIFYWRICKHLSNEVRHRGPDLKTRNVNILQLLKYFWFMAYDNIDWFSFTLSRSFKAISIQENTEETLFSNVSPNLPFYQACKGQAETPGSNFHAEIKTYATENIPKYVDLVKPRTHNTRCLSISGCKANIFHTELIKTYRYDEGPVFPRELSSSNYYPSWPFATPYRQHSAFSNGLIKRRHTIKKWSLTISCKISTDV